MNTIAFAPNCFLCNMRKLLAMLLLPMCSMGQDMVVTNDLDTIPCEIIMIVGNEVTLLPDGRANETVVLKTMLSSYLMDGLWYDLSTGDRRRATVREGMSADDLGPVLQMAGKGLRGASTGLVVGGASILVGGALIAIGGVLTEANPGAVENPQAFTILGAALIGIGGAGILSASVGLDRAGKRLQHVRLKAAGVPLN